MATFAMEPKGDTGKWLVAVFEEDGKDAMIVSGLFSSIDVMLRETMTREKARELAKSLLAKGWDWGVEDKNKVRHNYGWEMTR